MGADIDSLGGSPLKFALSNPWKALEATLDGSLHPGGEEATEDLLDRTGVSEGTRVLDAGCGAGNSLALARERGAFALGVDKNPQAGEHGIARADMTYLPFGDSAFDVVLSECSMCLCSDLSVALSEAHRVLSPDGSLALSDVTFEADSEVSVQDLPDSVAEALCLDEDRGKDSVVASIEDAGFEVDAVRDHHEDLLTMRDEIKEKVNYRELLSLMGERGERILEGIEKVDGAIERGSIGYVSVVATADR